MKDQGKTAPRRRELVGRNAFPPFKRNQIRWALHCYRWKEGISWEKYPYVIASALGIRELGEGLNSRDPRGFVLEGQTPGPEKLRLYERFIETVAPDYAKAFSEEGSITTFADFVSRYLNAGWPGTLSPADLEDVVTEIESNVYIAPLARPDDSGQLSHLEISVFRKIGDSPYLQMASIVVDVPSDVAGSPETPPANERDGIVDRITMSGTDQKYIKWLLGSVSFDDHLIMSEYWKGVAIPFADGHCYVAFLEDTQKQRRILKLLPYQIPWNTIIWCRFYSTEIEMAKCMKAFSFETLHMPEFEPRSNELTFVSTIDDRVQNLFSTMNINIDSVG